MRSRRNMLRIATWGAVLLVGALVTGCSNSSTPAAPSSSSPAASTRMPSAPAATEASSEPSPVISHLGRTKIVTLGDVEVRVTRSAIGFNIACNATNSGDQAVNIRVTVSVGDGKEWVRTTELDFPHVAAGRTGRETTTVAGDSYAGESPDDPKIYIDSVINY